MSEPNKEEEEINENDNQENPESIEVCRIHFTSDFSVHQVKALIKLIHLLFIV